MAWDSNRLGDRDVLRCLQHRSGEEITSGGGYSSYHSHDGAFCRCYPAMVFIATIDSERRPAYLYERRWMAFDGPVRHDRSSHSYEFLVRVRLCRSHV